MTASSADVDIRCLIHTNSQGRNEVYGIRDQRQKNGVGSGITGPGSGITSRGIGIRDQVFRQKIKYHKMTKFGLIGRKELPPLNSNVFLR